MLFLFSFLLACAVGAFAVWRLPFERLAGLLTPLLLLSSSGIAGALVVAAEAGSAAARYLGLIAILLACASFCGAFIATRRLEKTGQITSRL
ncbi:NAD(P) transhydrogenase alpha subunit [Sphingobium herbicidovorans NBRC 16415]|uniref:NAD(P) transhydrogenase alpha subunit n=1 Tax=Sphingobium herbicidovorans (strain ATCC 700291 / DSM 11019 / CCUG 56400 / KCTC 2939 / LMG 18315 / NBRC 16415 / MH) TaxID=1219045 RepID=A0A086PE33_SPHHM|nr:proton-translocating transhydrogenase family protein [Sphingobium herbicidovorans]KFG91651.1 NAD(P) transhydrogenase alpha subunit [Sphingobium herbicidovorans NBRC 16415]